MIDLSYLTEEEQGMIMSVLKRDTELKKVEEDRIKGLKRILSDKGKLKYLTGEWFYEAKSQRHRDRIHGSDIIKASLRKKNPITPLEIKQSEQPSLVNNENRDNLVPPTPLGNTETISAQPNDKRESSLVPPNVQQARLNLAARSPSRQRHNPFNEGSLEMETSERLDWQLANRADEQLKTSGGDLLSPSKPDIARPISVNSEGSGSLINIKVAPVPKKRTIIYKPQDSFSDSDGSTPRWIERTESQSNSNPQRRILKQSSSCSSNDSGLFINDNGRLLQPTKTPTSIHNSAYPEREPVDAMLSERLEDVVNWLDRKQVRFSPPVSLIETERASLQQDGREYRENDLLDLECSTPSDNEGETVKLDKNRENYEAENGPVSDREKLLEGVNMHLDITGIHLRTTEPQSAQTPCAELSLSDHISQPQQSQHAESHAPQVSYFPSPVEEKGKHILTHVGGSELYSNPEAPILKPADGEGDSLTKVLEWFSRSVDSIDRQDKDAGWKEFKEAKQESSSPKDIKISEDSATSHPVETQSPMLSSVLLDRSYGVHAIKGQEKSDDKVPTVGREDSSDSKPMYHAVHSSLTPETAYKPKLCISVAENQRPQNQDEKIYISKKEEHDEASTVSVSSIPKAAEQENEPEIQDVKSLQKLASLKAFWERENSGPKILISRSSTEHQNVVTNNRFTKQVEVGKINREPDVNLDIAGEVVLPKSGVPPLLEDVSGGKSKENIQPSPDTHKGKSVDLEEIIKDNGLHSIPFLAKVEGISREKNSELASTVANKSSPTIEISCMTNGLNEQEMKYTAKSIVISEEVYTSQKDLKGISPSGKEEGDIPVVSVFLSRCSTQVQQVTPVPLVRQGLNQPDSKTGKISQLKTFWELDKIGPKNAVCQPKEATGSELYKPLEVSSKQFASSEFDLRKKVTKLNSDDDKSVTPSELRQRPNFTVLSLKERMEKYSVSQTPIKSEFKNLRDFWRGEPSNKFDPQSPSTEVRCLNLENSQSEVQEATDALQKSKLQSPVETKMLINPNYYPKVPLIDPAKDHISLSRDGNPDVMIDSMNIQSPDKEFGENLPSVLQLEEKQQGFDKDMLSDSDATNPAVETTAKSFKVSPFVPKQDQFYHLLQPQRGSEQTSMSEATVSQSFTVPEDKVSDPLPAKITSLGNLNLRPQAFRQATSMFIRDPNEGQHKGVQENINKAHEESQSRRLPAYREGREIKPSGASEVIQPQPPLARSFIIRDFQHYLGITETTNAVKRENVSNVFFTPDAELEPSGGHRPIHVSTPVSSEKIPTRRGSSGQSFQPSEIAEDGSDFEYTISSTPQTWSRSWGSSALLDENEEQHPVRMALKRTLTRTMSSSKSLEDITSLPTIFTQAEESSKNNPEDELLLSMDDVSAVPFPPSSSFSDPNQIRNISKSVPAFLQKEMSILLSKTSRDKHYYTQPHAAPKLQQRDGRDSDSTSENSSYSGRQNRRGGSLTNLSNSSGMASMSSVSGSVMSVYSGDFGCVEVKGTIQFAINYVQKLKEFHIFVVMCKDLAAVDTKRNRSDPYVKSYLLPDKSRMGKRKTSVKKKTLNPTFNEILRYRVSMTALKTQTLNLSVWHNDTFGRNSFLGEVDLDLSKWDFSNTQMKEFTLRSRATSNLQPSDYRGEMRLALRFLPQIPHSKRVSNTGEVHIWVKDCKNLPIIRGTAVDPFVKCFVLPDTSRKSRQKTRVLKRTSDPVFNHTMVYDGFITEDLREACAELTVWDRDRLANHFLGGLRLGLGTGQSYGAEVDWMDSNPGESALWERMMQSPNEWVEDSLPLRMITKPKIVLK